MDRLSTLAVALSLVACDGGASGGGDSKPSRSRVDAVVAKQAPPVEASDFCEHSAPPQSAATLVWPALRSPVDPATARSPRWINVWATWCRPCVEELPRIAAWRSSIGKRVDYEMIFVSADSELADVTEFSTSHPEVKGTVQLADAEELQAWLKSVGVTDAGLPVHLFVDAQDKIRCIRMSEISDADEAAVAQVLSSL